MFITFHFLGANILVPELLLKLILNVIRVNTNQLNSTIRINLWINIAITFRLLILRSAFKNSSHQ